MKAIVWGSCGSLPSPLSSSAIRSKLTSALWGARDENFQTQADVEAYLDTLPHSAKGTYRANTSCVQIETKSDQLIFCDAGTGIRDYSLTIEPDSPPKTYHIFISHLHWDHIQGFPFFAPAYKAGNRIIFHGFHQATEQALREQMEAPCFPVPFAAMQAQIEFDIQEEGAEFEIDGVKVKTIKQEHPGDSWGYRFEEAGKSIVYSSDSEHGPAARHENYPFIDFYQSADVLIFDGQYTFEEASTGKRHWGHSDHMTGVELAARAKVRDLVIFHHEPSYSDQMIEEIHQDALKYREEFNRSMSRDEGSCFPKDLIIAYDGLVLKA